jgi:hypothetical protein
MTKFLIPIFIIGLFANIVAYWVKNILKNNDYSTSYISGYFRDTKNIFKLAKSTNDKNNRKRYFILAYAKVGLTILFVAFVVNLIANFSSITNSP